MKTSILLVLIAISTPAFAQNKFQRDAIEEANYRRSIAEVPAQPVSHDAALALAAEIQARWVAYASKNHLFWNPHAADTLWVAANYPDLHWDRLRNVGPILDVDDRAQLCGYPIIDEHGIVVGEANENGRLGSKCDGQELVWSWLNSFGHYHNLVDPDWQHAGFAPNSYAIGGGNHAGYAVFGRQLP